MNVFGFSLADAITGLFFAFFYGCFFGFLFGYVRFLIVSPVERETP